MYTRLKGKDGINRSLFLKKIKKTQINTVLMRSRITLKLVLVKYNQDRMMKAE